MNSLIAMFKDFAQNKVPADQRNYYLRDNMPEYSDVYSVLDVDSSGCWYGCFYFRNDSQYTFRDELTPKFEGAVVVCPPRRAESYPFTLAPGEDTIILFRRHMPNVQVSYSSNPKPRDRSDAELV